MELHMKKLIVVLFAGLMLFAVGCSETDGEDVLTVTVRFEDYSSYTLSLRFNGQDNFGTVSYDTPFVFETTLDETHTITTYDELGDISTKSFSSSSNTYILNLDTGGRFMF